MKIGIGSFAYRWIIGRPYYRVKNPMTLVQFLDKAIEHKVKGVMLCNNFSLETYSDRELLEAREKMENHAMFLETGARGSDANYFLSMLEASHKLGSRILRIVTDIHSEIPHPERKEQMQRVEKYLAPVLQRAKELGVVLALENYSGIYIEELVKILQGFDDEYLGSCVDTYNSATNMENPYSVTRELAPYAKAVHLKDFTVESTPRASKFTGVALGDGRVDFKKILTILHEHGYKGNANLELYIDRKESEADTIQWEEECVSKSIRYAKTELGLE